METSKKFLDENGLTTLWNQIEDNFISTDGIETIISAIDAIKADKESPEFTGVPTAPTANPNTNTKQIATTEFVNNTISELATRLNALADSDDTTLDQLSEIVTYIKNNKSLIDGITTSKVNVADIINNLTTNVTNKPLSAAQGVALKTLIDAITVPTKVSDLTNDSGYLTSYTETDPTVPAWAKAATKPKYTASEVGAIPLTKDGDSFAIKGNSTNNGAELNIGKMKLISDGDGTRIVGDTFSIVSKDALSMTNSEVTLIISPLTAIGSSTTNGIVFVEDENAQALAKHLQGVDMPIGMTVVGPALYVFSLTNFMGNKVSMVGTPTEDTDAANKVYVDSAIQTAIQTAIGNAIRGSY